MSEDNKKTPPASVGEVGALFYHLRHADPNAPKLPYKDARKGRRRKGQLNDGQWAPGYGPDAKKKPPR